MGATIFSDQARHRKLVERLRSMRLPGWIGGGILDWYSMALQRWAPIQDVETYFGARIQCDPKDSLQRSILLFGGWEPEISRLIENRLTSGDLFVDVGANIGYDSLLAARHAGRVVAIEASPQIFAKLNNNLARNPELAAKVRSVNVAVSDCRGKVDLYEFGSGNSGATTTLPSREGAWCGSIEAVPFREVLTDEERANVRLIKIDVESAEPVIVNDILDHLGDFPPQMELIIEANPDDDPAAFRALYHRLIAAGFEAYEVASAYSNAWLLSGRAAPLKRLTGPPAKRRDLLLTRGGEAATRMSA